MAKEKYSSVFLLDLIAQNKNIPKDIKLEDLIKLLRDSENETIAYSIENEFVSQWYKNNAIEWEKLIISSGGVLCSINNAALKLFVCLIMYLPQKTNKVHISDERIAELTNMTRPTVRKAKQDLIDHCLISFTEKIGSFSSIYFVNPDVVLIGKYTDSQLIQLRQEFYKSTGSTYKYNEDKEIYEVDVYSEPHIKFLEVVDKYKNSYYRDMMKIQRTADKIETIVGVCNNTLEHYKLEAQEKAAEAAKYKKRLKEERKKQKKESDDAATSSNSIISSTDLKNNPTTNIDETKSKGKSEIKKIVEEALNEESEPFDGALTDTESQMFDKSEVELLSLNHYIEKDSKYGLIQIDKTTNKAYDMQGNLVYEDYLHFD